MFFSVLVCFFGCNFVWYQIHLHWSHLKNLMVGFYKTIILRLKLLFCIKGTLIQIWKSPNVFVSIWKQYPKNFAFLPLNSLEFSSYLPMTFVNFSKSMLISISSYFLFMFVNKLFTYLTRAYLKMWKVF